MFKDERLVEAAMDKEERAFLLLSAVQKAALKKRLQTLMIDFHLMGVQAYYKGGGGMLEGNLPGMPPAANGATPKKRKIARRAIPGYEHGTMAKAIKPWLDLLEENGIGDIKLRPSDFQGLDIRRVSKSFSSAGCHRFGKGVITVQLVDDAAEGEALIVRRIK